MDFKQFGLPSPINDALWEMKYIEPTDIQKKAIPKALEGKDLLASAQTGTGKTGAFAIPMLAKLIENKNDTALILAPTRELARQVFDVIRIISKNDRSIKSALLIGGEHIVKQFAQLKARPRVVVGTPGRVNDHLNRRTLKLSNCHFLVLDEMDRMLDMGFGEQLETIVDALPEKRQTLMFSATVPKHIMKAANKYLVDPVRIEVGCQHKPADNIDQQQIRTKDSQKFQVLLDELDKRDGTVLVFVKTKRGAQNISERLMENNHRADAMHGDLQQHKRERVLRRFRSAKYRILVATDVASRGLDIPHIKHVINYDLPQCPEDYIHRIGRTARAGNRGSSLDLISPADSRNWEAINDLMNPGQKKTPANRSKRPDSRGPRRRRPSAQKPGKQFGAFRRKKSNSERSSVRGRPATKRG